MQAVRAALAARLESGRALLEELDAAIAAKEAQPRRGRGFLIVDPETGANKQGPGWRR
jgi:hypothetical protein